MMYNNNADGGYNNNSMGGGGFSNSQGGGVFSPGQDTPKVSILAKNASLY